MAGGSHASARSAPAAPRRSCWWRASNIEINGSALAVRPRRNTALGNIGIVNFSGVISGTADLNLNSPSSFRNTINLSGNNSYSGTTTIQQVAVTANSLANDGLDSALGSSGTIILGNNASATSLTFQDLSADGSTDRLLSIRTTGTNTVTLANSDADNTVSFINPGNTGAVSVSTGNNLLFILGGNEHRQQHLRPDHQ